jgi:antitoxin component YwqK of YwqJK toxin-antitoxin module
MRLWVRRICVIVFLKALCLSAYAQFTIVNSSVQYFKFGTDHHTRINDSNTFMVKDTFYNRVSSYKYYHPTHRLFGDYTEHLINGTKVLQAQLYHRTTNDHQSVIFDGAYQSWHNNGQLEISTSYSKGRINGDKQVWDESGILVSIEHFIMGRRGSINLYYHANSCQLKSYYRYDKTDGFPVLQESKNFSWLGELMEWYVRDSMFYEWTPQHGFYVRLFGDSVLKTDERWFTEFGILQKRVYYTGNVDSPVRQILEYDKNGVLVSSKSETVKTELIEMGNPEDTEEIFENFRAIGRASPVGGYYSIETTLNDLPKSVKVRKRDQGVYSIDVTIDKTGKVTECSWVQDKSKPVKAEFRNYITNTLYNSNWNPQVGHDKSVASIYRLKIVVKKIKSKKR